MFRQARSALGPADLALLLGLDTGLSREDVCTLLGYTSPASEIKSGKTRGTDESSVAPDSTSSTAAVSLQQKQAIGGFRPKYWQVLALQLKETEGLTPEPALPGGQPDADLDMQPQTTLREHRQLPSPALLTDRALWSRATRAARCAAHASQQEYQQWLAALSRAETPARPAIQQETQESGEIWLIMDHHPRLMLWWDELNRVAAVLHQRFGKSRARLIPLLDNDLFELSADAPLPWPGKQTRLLVFSDLGLLSGSLQRQQWQAVLQRWNVAGIQFSVFLPHSRPPQALRKLTGNRLELWDQRVLQPNKDILDDLLACLPVCGAVVLTGLTALLAADAAWAG